MGTPRRSVSEKSPRASGRGTDCIRAAIGVTSTHGPAGGPSSPPLPSRPLSHSTTPSRSASSSRLTLLSPGNTSIAPNRRTGSACPAAANSARSSTASSASSRCPTTSSTGRRARSAIAPASSVVLDPQLPSAATREVLPSAAQSSPTARAWISFSSQACGMGCSGTKGPRDQGPRLSNIRILLGAIPFAADGLPAAVTGKQFSPRRHREHGENQEEKNAGQFHYSSFIPLTDSSPCSPCLRG